jgi:hypothetical protein
MNYKHLQEIVNIEKKPIDYYTKLDNNKYMNLLSNVNNTLEYKPSESEENNKSICHWGQRKLFISELEFFINNYPEVNTNENKFYILYIGSAKGTHLLYLCQLFPEFEFILVDPAQFDTRLQYLDNVTIINRYFTDEDMKLFSDKSKYPNLFLISDIRYPNLSENDFSSQQQFVKQDMELQKKWYLKMKPYKALLKFRLPWNSLATKYLDGNIYFQAWAGRHSTETRLVPNGKMKVYNNKEYEEKLHYFNKVIRRKIYKKDIMIRFNHCGHCYDCYKEHRTFLKYCELKNISIENNKLNRLSRKLTSYLGYNNKF